MPPSLPQAKRFCRRTCTTTLLARHPADRHLEGQDLAPPLCHLINFAPLSLFSKKTAVFEAAQQAVTSPQPLPMAPDVLRTGEGEWWKSYLCSPDVKCLGWKWRWAVVCSPRASPMGVRVMMAFAPAGKRVIPAFCCETLHTQSYFMVVHPR